MTIVTHLIVNFCRLAFDDHKECIALIALLMIAGISLRLYRWRAAPAPRERPWYAEAALGLLDLTPAGLVLIFCFVPSISASIFRSWSCQAPSHS